MIRIKILIICFIILLSCTNNGRQNDKNLKEDTLSVAHAGDEDSGAHFNYYKFNNDSVTVLPFEVAVKLSPKAKDRIEGKETIIVSLYLTGDPKDTTLNAEDGQFYVASVDKEIKYGEIAKFNDIRFSKNTFHQLVHKNVNAIAYVYSGRKSSPDNLLECDVIFDSISNIAGKKLTLSAKLIYGDE